MDGKNSTNEYENKVTASKHLERVAVIEGLRTPFVKAFGVFETESALSLSVRVVTELVTRTGIQANEIDECIWGVVVPQVKNANLAREIILFAGLPHNIPGFTLNKACDSSLQTIEIAANKIQLGKNQLILAGGVEVLSDVPLPFSEDARIFFTKLSKAKTFGQKLNLLKTFSPKWLLPKAPSITEPFTGMTMGDHSEVMAVKNNISRKRQDELAFISHKNASYAWSKGYFKDEVIPVWSGKDKSVFVEKDNIVRSDTTIEALSQLKPVFDRKNGTQTAGNSSSLTDGASGVILASESYAKKNNLNIMGFILDSYTCAVNPNDQLLIGPAYVIPKLCQRNNLKLEDIDIFEIHEAFASQVLSCVDALNNETFCREKLKLNGVFGKIPMEKLNIQGGSLAIGHPFGATGARLVANALRIGKRLQKKYAIVTACAAGGIGMGILLETNL